MGEEDTAFSRIILSKHVTSISTLVVSSIHYTPSRIAIATGVEKECVNIMQEQAGLVNWLDTTLEIVDGTSGVFGVWFPPVRPT